MLNSHHVSRVLCAEPQSILYLLAPPTPGEEVNPELCSQLSLLDSPHGLQHSLPIFTGSARAVAANSECRMEQECGSVQSVPNPTAPSSTRLSSSRTDCTGHGSESQNTEQFGLEWT